MSASGPFSTASANSPHMLTSMAAARRTSRCSSSSISSRSASSFFGSPVISRETDAKGLAYS